MMYAFLKENRSARKISGLRRADPLPELAASIQFKVYGLDVGRRGLMAEQAPPGAQTKRQGLPGR
jgi:hypothetical protein